VYGGFGRITKEVWAKAEDHVLKIEKEYGKENCIDRSEIPPIIIDFLMTTSPATRKAESSPT
jgi:hypothetical protein